MQLAATTRIWSFDTMSAADAAKALHSDTKDFTGLSVAGVKAGHSFDLISGYRLHGTGSIEWPDSVRK